jgi:hypothetical protein
VSDMLDEIRFWQIVGEECWLAARWLDGTYKVVVQPWVGDGTVFVIDENAIEAAWREQCQRPIEWDVPSPPIGSWRYQPLLNRPADAFRITGC